MEPLVKESSASRILTARHISAEKPLPETNHGMNTSLLCYNHSLQPDFTTYLAALQPYAWILWFSSLLVLLFIWILYGVTLRSALKKYQDSTTNLVTVLSVYPLVASAAFIAILVPRATLLAEAIAQEVVMIAMYHFFCFVIAECGGTSQLIRRSGDLRLETRVMPCCCWPCCALPRPQVNKKSLVWLRCIVLQMPVIQGMIYIILLVLRTEDMMIYRRGLIYLQILVGISVLSGIWGVVMCVHAAEATGAKFRPRYLALQLVLIIVKLQYNLIKSLPDVIILPCLMSLHPVVFVNIIQNSLTILEMALLSIWAWHLYGKLQEKSVTKAQIAVATVLKDGVVLDKKLAKDGVDNKSFNTIDICENNL